MVEPAFKFIIFATVVFFISCAGEETETRAAEKKSSVEQNSEKNRSWPTPAKPLVTFIELGSVNCIPCRMMQPVMESVTKKYGKQIEVIFYDVWKPEQSHYARQYGIRVIPTQVFLDSLGREIYRHEGFFPEPELDKFLQARGLKPVTEG